MESFEMKKRKPPEVEKAILNGDTDAVRRFAEAGGKKAGTLSKQRADLRALSEAERAEEEKQYLKDAQTHEENMLRDVPTDDQ